MEDKTEETCSSYGGGGKKSAYKALVEKPEDSTWKFKWVGSKIRLKRIFEMRGTDDGDWIQLAEHRDKWRLLST